MPKEVRKAVWVGIVGVCALAGCSSDGGGGAADTTPVAVSLDLSWSGLGAFDVQAGVPAANRGIGRITPDGLTGRSGMLRLDPAAITVGPHEPREDAVAAHVMLVILLRFDSIDRQDTVCREGEPYGPFHLTLNSDSLPVSVSPQSVPLKESTIDQITSASFALCIRIESAIDATVDIARLNFNLRP